MYKYVLNSVVKISMMFAKYFEYYTVILRGAFFRGHAVVEKVLCYMGVVRTMFDNYHKHESDLTLLENLDEISYRLTINGIRLSMFAKCITSRHSCSRTLYISLHACILFP